MIQRLMSLSTVMALAVALTLVPSSGTAVAADGPTMLHPLLGVRPVVTGLVTPTSMAFLGANDLLILEKISGRVKRVTDGAVVGAVLDLAVNSASERGLLGIALHPGFPTVPFVYLYWTESSTGADSSALAAQISGLLDDASQRKELGEAGLRRARAEFSVARMTDRTLGLYERALR